MQSSLVFLFVCIGLSVGESWDNNWDQPLLKSCPAGQSFNRIRSKHDNGKEDRLYQFSCGGGVAVDTKNCQWTWFVNDWDGIVNFKCFHNFVVTGVNSVHSNSKEDRRWKFQCCPQISKTQTACSWTNWINDWDDPMDYTVPANNVIRGFYSVHDNGKEDRRWKVYICQV